jgi:ABC-type oligopeptide transport system substrate-binding subunit
LDARRELYAQAEEILVYGDAAIIPIYWYTTAADQALCRADFAVTGQNRYEKWGLAAN